MRSFAPLLFCIMFLACQEQALFKKGKKVKTGQEISQSLNSAMDAGKYQPNPSIPADTSIADSETRPTTNYAPVAATTQDASEPLLYTASGASVTADASDTPLAINNESHTAEASPLGEDDPLMIEGGNSNANYQLANPATTQADPKFIGPATTNTQPSVTPAPAVKVTTLTTPTNQPSVSEAKKEEPAVSPSTQSTAGFYGPAKNTLIIGDSHSDKGGQLGSSLIDLFSKEGQTDLYSISGSKINDWLNDLSGEKRKDLLTQMGGSVGSSKNPSLEYDKGKNQSYADWNLLELLKKHETDRLVLQLGTNEMPSELEAKYIDLIAKTCQQVQEFFVILPPVQQKKDFSTVNQSIENKLQAYNQNAPESCPPIKITVSNAWKETKEEAQKSGSIAGGMYDDYHLYKKPAETAWINKIEKSYHSDPIPTEKDAVVAALGFPDQLASAGTVDGVICNPAK